MNSFEQLALRKTLNNFEKLKKSVSDWIVALDTKQYELEKQVQTLKQEIRHLKFNRGPNQNNEFRGNQNV
ncbi:MAG: hypothetical protein QF824_02515 [Candidatus Woesearchaeota archaeon]|jgi:predicted  nucleic acid-binding Zn-ribbon protein|nr:hypothetical protein [Candidatus Woesearchaeota archaeon]